MVALAIQLLPLPSRVRIVAEGRSDHEDELCDIQHKDKKYSLSALLMAVPKHLEHFLLYHRNKR